MEMLSNIYAKWQENSEEVIKWMLDNTKGKPNRSFAMYFINKHA
jgi:hypothetical protein